MQGGVEIAAFQFPMRGSHTSFQPIADGMLDGDVGLLPIQLGWNGHFFQPRLARPPAKAAHEIGGGSERVRRGVDEIDAPIAIIINALGEVEGGQELELPQFPRPRPAHLFELKIAARDDA